MDHFDGLTGSEAGPDGSGHVPVDGGSHSTFGDVHDPNSAFDVPSEGPSHEGTVSGGIPDPAVASGVHTVTAAGVNIDHPIFISEQLPGGHQPVDITPHHESMLSHMAGQWLEPAAAAPVLGGVGRIAQKWVIKRRLTARTADDLAQRLAEGERVVAVVDADEFDQQHSREGRLSEVGRIPGQGAEVPVEVLSVDRRQSQTAGGVVTVDDGGPVGTRTVPLEVFEAAWQLADCLAYAVSHGAGPTDGLQKGDRT